MDFQHKMLQCFCVLGAIPVLLLQDVLKSQVFFFIISLATQMVLENRWQFFVKITLSQLCQDSMSEIMRIKESCPLCKSGNFPQLQ